MCKVFGVAANPPEEKRAEVYKLLTNFFAVMNYNQRDTDATGFFAMTDRGGLFDKEPLPALKFLSVSSNWRHLKERQIKLAICHARGAMSSAANNANNHPFVGRNWAFIHEGWVYNHWSMADSFGLKLDGRTDSEIFLRLAENHSYEPMIDFRWAFSFANAPTILAAIDHSSKEPSLFLASNAAAEKVVWLLYSSELNSHFFCDSTIVADLAIRRTFGSTKSLDEVFNIIEPMTTGVVARFSSRTPGIVVYQE